MTLALLAHAQLFALLMRYNIEDLVKMLTKYTH